MREATRSSVAQSMWTMDNALKSIHSLASGLSSACETLHDVHIHRLLRIYYGDLVNLIMKDLRSEGFTDDHTEDSERYVLRPVSHYVLYIHSSVHEMQCFELFGKQTGPGGFRRNGLATNGRAEEAERNAIQEVPPARRPRSLQFSGLYEVRRPSCRGRRALYLTLNKIHRFTLYRRESSTLETPRIPLLSES